ncbi:hypothetical protein QQP08_020083 [Theobroma cacao]|nr:hypothetical protein QQP08_020083 [Theobroma cacao]
MKKGTKERKKKKVKKTEAGNFFRLFVDLLFTVTAFYHCLLFCLDSDLKPSHGRHSRDLPPRAAGSRDRSRSITDSHHFFKVIIAVPDQFLDSNVIRIGVLHFQRDKRFPKSFSLIATRQYYAVALIPIIFKTGTDYGSRWSTREPLHVIVGPSLSQWDGGSPHIYRRWEAPVDR